MTKTKLHETVLALCATHEASEVLTNALSELTKPKVGGKSSVEDYTVFNEDGSVAYVFCSYHKQWEPVAVENEDGEIVELFKTDAKSKNGYTRSCIDGDTSWREQAKVFNTSKNAIMQDVLDEVITGAEAKEQIGALTAARQVHTDREDGLGETERPEA